MCGDVKKSWSRNWWLAVILVLGLYLLPLAWRPLMTPDETRYAEIPREMLTSGDWVVPYLGGLRYFEKPVMGYWLGAISEAVFSENNFAVRFPAAFTTLAAAMLLFLFLRRIKDRETAVVGTGIFLSCALVYFVGTFAVLDAPTALFMTGALLSFYLAAQAARRRTALGWLAVMGICCGGAFLAKGFIALAVPAIVIAPFMIWERRWKDLLWMPWLPLLTALLVVLPWAWLIHGRDHDFWRYFIVVEHWERFTQDNSSQHPAPFWYFVPVIIGGMMPWTLLLPGILTKLKWRWPQDRFTRYAWCWVVFPFLFFSASSGKLGTYILPCFPALAFLLALGVLNYLKQPDHRIFNRTCRWTAIVLLVVLIGVAGSQILASSGITEEVLSRWFKNSADLDTALFRNGETGKFILLIAAVAGWCGGLLLAVKTTDYRKKLLWFGAGTALVLAAAHPVCPNLILERKAPGAFLLRFAGQIRPDDLMVCYNNTFVPASWYYKRNNIYMYHKGGELEYGLNKPEARGRLLSDEDFKRLIADPKRKQRVVFLMQSKRFRDGVPPATVEVYEANRDRIMLMIYDPVGRP